jgi:glutaredoxin
MAEIKVYGADWCGDTQRTLKALKNLDVDFEYINVDDDPSASEWVKKQNGGKEKKPTVVVGNEILTTPDDSELEHAIRNNGAVH